MIQVADNKAAKTKKADSDDDDDDDDKPALGKRKEPESSGGDNCRVFLGGLPFKASEKDVKDMFKKCGTIKSVELPMNNEGRPAGFGFLVFEKVNIRAHALLFLCACAKCVLLIGTTKSSLMRVSRLLRDSILLSIRAIPGFSCGMVFLFVWCGLHSCTQRRLMRLPRPLPWMARSLWGDGSR
jgi:hypothetical protein